MPVPRPRLRRAAAAALLAVLVAAPTVPARADPGGTRDGGEVGRARAEAARIQQRIDQLHTEVEVLAEAHAATTERLDAVIRASVAHQRELADGELALEAARAGFEDQVRSLYVRGPMAPFELLLVVRDGHELAVARRAVDRSLDAGTQAIAQVRQRTGRVAALVGELQSTQAEVLGVRRRLAAQHAGIERRLALQRGLLAGAEHRVRRLVRVEPVRARGYVGATRPAARG